MRFFIPNTSEIEAQTFLDSLINSNELPIYAFTYQHDYDLIRVRVGVVRRLYKGIKGKGGSSTFASTGRESGSRVRLVTFSHGSINTYTETDGVLPWNNPAISSIDSVERGSIEYFDDMDYSHLIGV